MPEGKYFVIVSRTNDSVLDISGASEDPGAEVITYERSETDNQLWYLHSTTGTIRSKLNDYCLDIAGENSAATSGGISICFTFGLISY